MKIFGIKRESWETHTTYSHSTNSGKDPMPIYEYRLTYVWKTFMGIKIKKLFSYYLLPTRFKNENSRTS